MQRPRVAILRYLADTLINMQALHEYHEPYTYTYEIAYNANKYIYCNHSEVDKSLWLMTLWGRDSNPNLPQP